MHPVSYFGAKVELTKQKQNNEISCMSCLPRGRDDMIFRNIARQQEKRLESKTSFY